MDHGVQHGVPSRDELLTIPEAIVALRIGRSHFFTLKRQGRIGTVRLGGRTLVPRREISRIIDEALDATESDTLHDVDVEGTSARSAIGDTDSDTAPKQ